MKEKAMKVVFLIAACVSILAVALICIFLFAGRFVKAVKEADRMLLKERKVMNDRDRSEKTADSEKQRGVDTAERI